MSDERVEAATRAIDRINSEQFDVGPEWTWPVLARAALAAAGLVDLEAENARLRESAEGARRVTRLAERKADEARLHAEYLRERLGPCVCDHNPSTTDGPQEDCPEHGRPHSYWVDALTAALAREQDALTALGLMVEERDEARRELAGLRAGVVALEAENARLRVVATEAAKQWRVLWVEKSRDLRVARLELADLQKMLDEGRL